MALGCPLGLMYTMDMILEPPRANEQMELFCILHWPFHGFHSCNKCPLAVNESWWPYSAIHKATSRAVPGFAWYNSCLTEKNSLSHEWENGLWRVFLPAVGNPVAL